MRRIALLAVMVFAATVLSLLTLRHAASHFDLNFWYMLTSSACHGQKDPLNLMFTHYASADNIAWELDWHGYWPNTEAGDGHILWQEDALRCPEQTLQRLTVWLLEGGTEKRFHVRLWEGLDSEPAWGGRYTVGAAHVDFNRVCGVCPACTTVHFSDEYNRARDLVLVQLGLPPHAHEANRIWRGNWDDVTQVIVPFACEHTAPGSDGYVWYINLYPGTCGDADSDGDVDAVDALFVLQHVVGLRGGDNVCEPGSGVICLPHTDANQDQHVNVIDSLLILRYVVGYPGQLCAY